MGICRLVLPNRAVAHGEIVARLGGIANGGKNRRCPIWESHAPSWPRFPHGRDGARPSKRRIRTLSEHRLRLRRFRQFAEGLVGRRSPGCFIKLPEQFLDPFSVVRTAARYVRPIIRADRVQNIGHRHRFWRTRWNEPQWLVGHLGEQTAFHQPIEERISDREDAPSWVAISSICGGGWPCRNRRDADQDDPASDQFPSELIDPFTGLLLQAGLCILGGIGDLSAEEDDHGRAM